MKTYKIPVVWQMYGHIEVEAESLDEAKERIYDSRIGLPDDGSYIEDSMEIDKDGIPEDYDGEKR